jgi:ABC-type Fe3+ transport system permease subunit
MSGDQAHWLTTGVFTFPWDRFFDQGEQVFEVVFLLLWLAFVVFLACSAARFLRENSNKKAMSRKKRRGRTAPPAGGSRQV